MKSSSRFLLVILLLSTNLKGFSQKKQADLYFALNQDFQMIEDLKNSTYLLRVKKINDSSWRHDIYHLLGPLVQSAYCKDQNGTQKNGKMYTYFENGRLKEQRNYTDNQPDGNCYTYNDTGKIVLEKIFRNGALIKTINYLDSTKKDSLTVKDSTEREASFKGGITAWGKYLSSNFDYPERALNNKIGGIVSVQFIINKEGLVEETHMYRSVELSLDDEAMRLINKAPKWLPAIQFGRIVKSYFRQPIICKLN